MDMPILAVSLHNEKDQCIELEEALEDMSVEVYSAKRCVEAKELIANYQPLLLFVDLDIWKQLHDVILDMAISADQFMSIIIVASSPDIEMYVSAIEQGAFNFVAPPFARDVLAMIVYTAALDARNRRRSLSREPLPKTTRSMNACFGHRNPKAHSPTAILSRGR